jgi:hypothetical protein
MDQNRSRPKAQSLAKDPKPASVSESLNRGKEAVSAAAGEAMNAAASDLQAIRNDLINLKDTLAKFMGQATHEAAKSARLRERGRPDEGRRRGCRGCRRQPRRQGQPVRRHGRRAGEDLGRGDRSAGSPQSPRRSRRRSRHWVPDRSLETAKLMLFKILKLFGFDVRA